MPRVKAQVNRDGMRNYLQENNQMWQKALEQAKGLGGAAHAARMRHLQKMGQQKQKDRR